MRFTSAFIPLLSASLVLAQLNPYAGYRLQAEEDVPLTLASATFIVPEMLWNCNRPGRIQDQNAFVGVGIGNPAGATCSNRGIEAGVNLYCSSMVTSYRAYWKLYPDSIQPVDFVVAPGHEIYVEIKADDDHTIKVMFINLTTYLHFSVPNAGHVSKLLGCLGTAAWFLRASLIGGGTGLLPPPTFIYIIFTHGTAKDFFQGRYAAGEGAPLIMMDAERAPWAHPESDPQTLYSFTIWP